MQYWNRLMIGMVVLFTLIGCAAPNSDKEGRAIPEVVDKPVAEPSISEIIEDEPNSEATQPIIKKKEPEFKISNPTLTYDGAYNGPLYGTSEQVGSASMDSYFENLDRNGINFFIGMFGIDGEPTRDTLTSDQGLGEVISAAQKHPHRVVPFFNPGIGGEEVEQYLGAELTRMYRKTLSATQQIAGDIFIRGLGEVETQEWNARHNDQRVLDLIDLAQANNINFMFHPVASKIDDVVKIIELYPDTTFLIHMYREDLDKSMAKLIKIMKEHDNLYFSIDAAHILHVNGNDIIYAYDSTNKQSSINKFVSTYNSKEESIISSAISAYKPLVGAVPDKVMWGTEIGPEYAFDPEVFDRAIKISRFVIAGFAQEHQEAVAYKNALRVFGEGVVVDPGIAVLDTSAWPECSAAQMDDCDTSCGNPDTDALTTEQENCFSPCLIGKKCREVVEMDVG